MDFWLFGAIIIWIIYLFITLPSTENAAQQKKNFYLTQGSANWGFAPAWSSISIRIGVITGPKYLLYQISYQTFSVLSTKMLPFSSIKFILRAIQTAAFDCEHFAKVILK